MITISVFIVFAISFSKRARLDYLVAFAFRCRCILRFAFKHRIRHLKADIVWVYRISTPQKCVTPSYRLVAEAASPSDAITMPHRGPGSMPARGKP